MTKTIIYHGAKDASVAIVLAHGVGAPMDSASMNAAARALAEAGFRVARVEFDYMASRRAGNRKPPPHAEKLMPEYLTTVVELSAEVPLIIGDKSKGGRVASMVTDQVHAAEKVAGLLCLGYPFHPPACRRNFGQNTSKA
jgi:predicted alpha/beta-hydrolase family hydrolase